MKKTLLLILLFASLSFASLAWQTSVGSEVTTKLVYFEKNIAVGSGDGKVYAINPSTGAKVWNVPVGKTIIDLSLFDGELVSATTAGRIVRIEKDGKIRWELDLKKLYNTSYIYAIDSNSNYLYAATSNGIYRITKSGEGSKIYETRKPPTVLNVEPTYLLVGAGDTLIKLDLDGKKQWEKTLDFGNFWNSNPITSESFSMVYVGALDNKLHAYNLNTGYERWNVLTNGWVLTTPLLADNTVFFGSTDGNFYAVDAGNGDIKWKIKLSATSVSQPGKGVIGGKNAIFVGCTDGNLYALDMESGDVIWKNSVSGRIDSPLFYQNRIIIGSSDGSVYSFTVERACSIDSPVDGAIVGKKEVVVSGRSVSEAGPQQVYVNINNLGWTEANTSEDGSWMFIIDPSRELVDGLNTISCKVVDRNGEETGVYTSVSVVKDPNAPLDSFIVTISEKLPIEDKPFTIYVNSKEDGSPVDRFALSIDGKNYTGNKNITITLEEPGSYKLTISKIGFTDNVRWLNIARAGIDPLFIGIAGVLLLLAIWFIYTRFVKKVPGGK